jgi:uncharacterized RDD family membrane protein YckC
MSQADFPDETEPFSVAESQRPAGFWIRYVALLIDSIVLSPLAVASYFNYFSAKSLPLFLLLSIPALVYKPLMESRYGATLGKMALGLRVIDQHGRRLNIGAAYVRFSPWLALAVVGLITNVWVFSTPQLQTVSGFVEFGQLMQQSPVNLLSNILNCVFLIDCVTAAFTYRKRAIHDMIAGSYCVRNVA